MKTTPKAPLTLGRPADPLDRGLLLSNLTLAGAALGVVALGLFGVRPSGWLDVPVAVAVFAWFFATPLLAGFGGYRARSARRVRVLAAHATLGATWFVGLLAALVLPILTRGA